MIQEYLFVDKSKQSEIENYKPEGVQVDIADIQNSECWTVVFATPRDDETTAKKMSDINKYIVESFHPIVLSNESAAYFNKRLYPLANEFERKLRKLLYLKSALNPDDKASKNIKDLEKKELGTIFELLFADDQFIVSVKKKINQEMTWKYTKSELQKVIDTIEENTNWDHLIGEEAVPELRTQFLSVRSFRNDIMHAHNINYKAYQDAKKLFEIINQQIDHEIGKIIAIAENPSMEGTKSNYNTALSEAINNMKLSSAFVSSLMDYAREAAAIQVNLTPALQHYQKILANLPKIPPDYFDSFRELSELLREAQGYSELLGLNGKQSDPQQETQSNDENIDSSRDNSQKDHTEEKQDGENENGNTRPDGGKH